MAKGRRWLPAIELLPEQCSPVVAWAASELQNNDRTQLDIYAEFVAKLEAVARDHRGEIEFKIPSFTAFNRFSINLATMTQRMNDTREIAATLAKKFDAKASDDLTLIAAEAIKTLIFELLTSGGEAGIDPKGAMALANALRAATQAQGVSTLRRQKVEDEFAGKVEKVVEIVERAKGLTQDTVAGIKAQILGCAGVNVAVDINTLLTEEDWANHRREMMQTMPAAFEGKALPDVLLPHQKELLQATAAHNLVVTDKSRRVGATWGVGADAVLSAGSARNAGGMDVLYLGYNLDMAREFIDCCGMWARAFAPACSQVHEYLFTEQGENGADHAIKAFRIQFASGFEIVALSSKPRSLRGRQGYVILDEFAFHDDAAELLKSAMALLIWGGKVLVISTHNGVDNPFNELIQDIRAGRRPGAVVRVTFDEALGNGLYQRVCLKTGKTWSAEAEAKWRAGIYKSYGSGADEELRCIPSQSTGSYLPRTLIQARMHAHIPVIRWTAPKGFVDWPEDLRDAEIDAFCDEKLKPLLDALDPRARSCLAQDFGRSGDLSVLHPMQVRRDLSRSTPFLLELRDVPFESQKRIVFYIKARLPRFFHAAFDATGNGAYLAEVCRQKFGTSVVSEIKLSLTWYLLNMPKLKAAFEDGTIELPLDDDVMTDYRAIQMTKGVAKVPDDARSQGADGFPRHGDAAIAGALAIYASEQDGGDVGAGTTGDTRVASKVAEEFGGRFGGVEARADLSDFMRM